MTTTTVSAVRSSNSSPSLVRASLVSGAAGAVAALLLAVIAKAAGVSLETPPGEPIPVFGFAVVTAGSVAVGALIAAAIRRWAKGPASTFVKISVALTALSILAPLMAQASGETKAVLVVAHVVVAAIVVPAIARSLAKA